MDNKLSELSKPVAWENSFTGRISKIRDVAMLSDDFYHSLYSQEYVSALLSDRDTWQAAAQAGRDEWRAQEERAENAEQELSLSRDRIAELEGIEQTLNVANDATRIWKERAKTAESKLESVQAIANEYLQLIHHMDAGGDFFEFQRDKNNG